MKRRSLVIDTNFWMPLAEASPRLPRPMAGETAPFAQTSRALGEAARIWDSSGGSAESVCLRFLGSRGESAAIQPRARHGFAARIGGERRSPARPAEWRRRHG